MFKVEENGIYYREYYTDNLGATVGSTNKLIIPKETFMEAFNEYIMPKLFCYDLSAAGTQPEIEFNWVKKKENK